MKAKESAVGKTKRYVIRGGVEGHERLRLLSEVMGPSTRALLAEVGIPAGAICLDVGCGGGDVTFELAHAAGPTGRAIGVDLDEIKLDIARREAAHHGLSNITFETRNVTEWEPGERFDVIYARFLLTHLPNPEAVVSALRQKLRPDGVIIVEDIDYRGHFAEPDCRALDRAVELYTKSVQARGADPNIGPRLPGLLRQSGLEDIQMRLVHPAALHGGIKLLICVTLETSRTASRPRTTFRKPSRNSTPLLVIPTLCSADRVSSRHGAGAGMEGSCKRIEAIAALLRRTRPRRHPRSCQRPITRKRTTTGTIFREGFA